MKRLSSVAGLVALAAFAMPALASAQVYYYAPNTTSGAFNYGSSQYIPAAAMPYVQMGQQMQEQYQQQYAPTTYTMPYTTSSYSYPTQYQSQYQTYPTQYQSQSQSQSQYQYQNSYPTYQQTSYSSPSYGSQYYSSGSNTGMNQYGEYSSEPQSVSYPSGTYGAFGTQLCYWSDSTTYEPCDKDPQQWIQDPYTGGWY
jgi:hypothetical protein